MVLECLVILVGLVIHIDSMLFLFIYMIYDAYEHISNDIKMSFFSIQSFGIQTRLCQYVESLSKTQ